MSLSNDLQTKEQDQNTAKLVMSTFYKVTNKNGVTSTDIAKYLQEKFGDVWKLNILTGKAEETLKRSAQLGFLDQRGDRYISKLARELRCGRRKRRRTCRKRRRQRSRCSRRRPRRRRRRRRRQKPCCCG